MGPPVVMIVEDERDLADLYRTWLSDAYEVLVANTVTQAIDHLDESIDVVLLDRRMPDQPGDAVLDAICDRELNCRIAMVTAIDPDFDIIDMGFDDYIVKPISADDVRTLVSQLVHRSSYEEELREYFAVASKKAILESEKTTPELQRNADYAALQDRFRRIRKRVDDLLNTSPDSFFDGAFRDLETDRGDPT